MIKDSASLVGKILGIIFIVIMLTITYVPILLVVIFSFSMQTTMGDWQAFKLTIEPFIMVFNSSTALPALFNSLILGLVSSLLATVIGTFTAIGLYNMKRKVRSVIEYSGQITMFNADIVTALAMLLFFVALNMFNDWIRLIISHTIICLPYVVMSVLPRLAQLDPNVYEAGLDLGASPMRTLLTVVMPQLVGGMIAGFALAFTISMDDFTLSVIVGSGVDTIPKLLYSGLSKGGINQTVRALSTIMLLAVMAILVIINIIVFNRKRKTAKRPA